MLKFRQYTDICACGEQFTKSHENEATYYCEKCGLPNPKFITGLQDLKHEDIDFVKIYGRNRPLTMIINLVENKVLKKELIKLLVKRSKIARFRFYKHTCMFCKYGFDDEGYGYNNSFCSQECLDFTCHKDIERWYFKE